MQRLLPGEPGTPGSHPDREGVHFAVYASRAEAVDLCLFDAHGRETARLALPEQHDGLWHGYLPGVQAGQRYGYRVQGVLDRAAGLRHNPAKLLTDPWARALDGPFRWSGALLDDNPADSAGWVPKSLVTAPGPPPAGAGPARPWKECVVYETHVRGYTMQHPEVPAKDRGRFAGLRNAAVLQYLKALGISSVELMPVFAGIDEAFLARRGLRNYWGYNSVSYFALEPRFGDLDPLGEFRDMLDAIHDAGLEVLLDVVYNHTGEGDADGPTLSLRGLDNLAYYRTEPGRPGMYVNDTGCGNTLNADHPRVQELLLGSLRYWHRELGVDGFRFDLAPVLGRSADGFNPAHPLLTAINADPQLQAARLVAEPWDPGPGGYQLGRFPQRFSEWNDRFRDSVRRFWRGDDQQLPEFAQRVDGSLDLFRQSGRGRECSVNFITSHDGFTLLDLVSYQQRHNQANGEDNRDGHQHNYSCNHGIEGPTARASVNALRRRHRLNLLATLLLSRGVPMLLAGDEFGNSQAGNNNAYAQDNPTGWLDWRGLESDPDFTGQVRALLSLRRQLGLFASLPGPSEGDQAATPEQRWRHPEGHAMGAADWIEGKAVMQCLRAGGDGQAVALCINGGDHERVFQLPPADSWQLAYSSDARAAPPQAGVYNAAAWSIACLATHWPVMSVQGAGH